MQIIVPEGWLAKHQSTQKSRTVIVPQLCLLHLQPLLNLQDAAA
jgi:hypothetical protein